MAEYRTTMGTMQWDERACDVEYADDPQPPKGEGWVMCGSGLGELRNSKQTILWYWTRAKKARKAGGS
jgi:hypothetical protein